MSYTKGEWKAMPCNNSKAFKVKANEDWIATVWDGDGINPKDNAHIMAAAPKLYEACKGDALDETLRELNKKEPNIDKIKGLIEYKKHLIESAIAAAEGKKE